MVKLFSVSIDFYNADFIFSIPLIAGVLASCAAACAFFAEHILALTNGRI
jgi:hypothetical protein